MIEKFRATGDYSRLDHFLVESLAQYSRSQLEKFIKADRVKVNGVVVNKKNREIVIDDWVEIDLPEAGSDSINRQDGKPACPVKDYQPSINLKKLFEDDYLLIIDKPAGISVHPGAGEREETIFDIFAYYYPQVKEMDITSLIPHPDDLNPSQDQLRPGIVHRLDKETSGVLVLAKDLGTMKRMQKQFKRREVEKTYIAIATGRMRHRSGTIDVPLMRSRRDRKKFTVARGDFADQGREAITEFTVIREFADCTLVKLFPHTGRTHQLRVHLAHFGCPVLGDKVYGHGHGQRQGQKTGEHLLEFKRLALHAYSVSFVHPVNGAILTATSPLPKVFRDFIKNLYDEGKKKSG